jgi:glutamate synthase (ferredoxin)
MQSALALVHSRFSTNTFPSWDRAHPNRFIAHNGEINTLRGNITGCMRDSRCSNRNFSTIDLKKVLPVICPDGSDSGMFDNCLEMLVLSGRSLPHAMMMMIPELWQHHESMSEAKKAFLRVSPVSDGAVGWACFHFVHRRHPNWCTARP